ncbi:C-type lectin domain family 12 member A [Rousettus aegyptiacus]|uniref:C-type lectin domain family 12 member A n=1 Tax=Rousettus aegyptiacus TaxID=9407 RepID=A0A7J8JBK7_ROUAE|nr:C-type lectin domain family 12 member A [Rousettus aegyptiacus]KAF6494254.1 C-type lectin domain family 12 member A [Rousettus aegyptiacus]
MSDEVTYADLKFQDCSRKIKSIQEIDQVGIKAPPARPHVWHRRTLALTLLCLLQLIGLGVLGSIFHLTSKREMEKFKTLHNFKEELQRNISLLLMDNMNSSKKISNLSITLQETATKLCYELYRKEPEHKCKPCPRDWMWHKDRCYILVQKYDTWQNSVLLCSSYNSSLLKIKNKSILEFVTSKEFYNYWLGLSPTKEYNDHNLDERIISSDWFTGNTDVLNSKMNCGYVHRSRVYYADCASQKYSICEKLANLVKIESILMNEVPD